MYKSSKSFVLHLVSFVFLLSTFYLLLMCSDPTKPPIDNGPDTTSHDFSWTIDTIGTYGSYLKDVAIIDENNIWAVGEIHTNETDRYDSLGVWQPPFNALHWNGSEWELRRLFKGNTPIYPVRGLWTVSNEDIWLAAGSIYHWNGKTAQLSYLRDTGTSETVEKLWYQSPNSIYGVGNKGLIVHYDGQSWQRLESGTDIDLTDVWGSPDGSVVWTCGHSDFEKTVLLKIANKIVETVYLENPYFTNTRADSLSGLLTSVWTEEADSVYVMTSRGMYKIHKDSHGEAQHSWYDNNPVNGFPRRMRGTADNNIITVGEFNTIVHYNGSTWYKYTELTGRANWRSVDLQDDFVIAAGPDYQSNRAVIAIGRK